MPLISIVIPTHNAGRFLAAAVHSVYRQSVDVEVVIVDDASQDETAAVAQQLAAEHRSTRVVTLTACAGVSGARDAGLAATNPAAPYVLFLDADDALIPGRVSALLSTLEAAGPGCPAAVGSAVIVGEDGQPGPAEGWEAQSGAPIGLPELDRSALALPSMVLWRRSALRLLMPWPKPLVVGGVDIRCEDILLNRRAVCLGQMATTKTPTTYYRRHPGQWSADREKQRAARAEGAQIHLQALHWAEGEIYPASDSCPILDPLLRTRCGVNAEMTGNVVITCASAGWEEHLAAMLASLRAVWDGAIAVFVLGEAPEVERVARQHMAAVIPVEPLAPLGPWSKSVLYTASRSIPNADAFVAIDADCIVHESPEWLFPVDTETGCMMARDGNGIWPDRTGDGANLWRYAAGFAGLSGAFCRALGLPGALGLSAFPANDGIFAVAAHALYEVETEARRLFFASWPHLDTGGTWWNQILWNAAAARVGLLRELPARWNVQMHARVKSGRVAEGTESPAISHYTSDTKPLMLGKPMGAGGAGTGTGCVGCIPSPGFRGLRGA